MLGVVCGVGLVGGVFFCLGCGLWGVLGVSCGMVHSPGGCVGVVAWVRVGLTGREAEGPWHEPEKGD